ncbi:MAG: SCO6745 family protein [Pseudonocardiaceae bacterium]
MERMTTVAHRTRGPIVTLGGAFMTAPEMTAQEVDLGLPERSLYFRGRSAVLGDPPAHVVTTLFGIFPDWLVELVIGKATPAVPAAAAVDAYARASAAWGRRVLADVPSAARAATLLYRIVDSADASALPLVAGWRAQARPHDAPARLAHALMLARELRGGLHFAALRAGGLGVTEAVVADPGGGRGRLLRTGWRVEDADALIARAHARSDLVDRWQRAEQLTDESFGLAIAVLTDTEADHLVAVLDELTGIG